MCLKQWLKSYYQFKVLMTSSKCKGKKHAFLRHLGFQTSKGDRQYHIWQRILNSFNLRYIQYLFLILTYCLIFPINFSFDYGVQSEPSLSSSLVSEKQCTLNLISSSIISSSRFSLLIFSSQTSLFFCFLDFVSDILGHCSPRICIKKLYTRGK